MWLKRLHMGSKSTCSKLLLREVEIFTQENTASRKGQAYIHKLPFIMWRININAK